MVRDTCEVFCFDEEKVNAVKQRLEEIRGG